MTRDFFMVMRLSEVRFDIKKRLKQVGIDVKDADFVLSEILKKPITELFMDCELSDKDIDKINNAIGKRIQGMPVTKIFNKAYFYGLTLYVDENVLSPRPETESLVDLALKEIADRKLKVLDLCTGSGAIACAIKSHSDVEMWATDISEKALSVAKRNAKNLNLDINFVKSDMFESLKGQFDMILTNPPYIETDVCKTLDVEVKNYDPMLALDGGVDGLDFYRTINDNMNYLKLNGTLIMEIGYNQGESIKQIFSGYDVGIVKDYSDNDRIAVVRRTK